MKRVLADPFDLFGDGPASTWEVPALPTETNAKAALERDVKAAIAELSGKLNPVTIQTVATHLKAIAYATRHRDNDASAWKDRTRVYHFALQDVPADMWESLTKQAILKFTWFPAAAELNALVRPYVEQRQRMLGRARQILDKMRGAANKAIDKPAVVESTEDRLAASIVSLRKHGLHDRAAAAERRLAAMQQRDVEPWALAVATPAAEPPKERDRGGPPQKLGATVQAALNRSLAKKHREQGHPEMAARLEREADELAPLDVDEPIADHAP